MLIKFLNQISKVELDLIRPIYQVDKKIINTAIFSEKFKGNLSSNKKAFFKKMNGFELSLLKIEANIRKTIKDETDIDFLLHEIEGRKTKIVFLKQTYDIEAKKIDKSYIIGNKVDIDFYNKSFFGVTNKDLEKGYYINECIPEDMKITRGELNILIEIAKEKCPDLVFNFGDFPNFSHTKGSINITEKKEYNLQNLISIFFHETTHFFRGYNGKKSLGFRFKFNEYMELEEGAAIYNEYLYGNQITNYGKFNPYYNLCYKVLREDISETAKKQKIYEILKCKGYSKSKSTSYYYRFMKFSSIGSNELFLKDMIYWQSYKNVKKLIRTDSANYDKIMSGQIGEKQLDSKIFDKSENFDTKTFFKEMVKEIKKITLITINNENFN